VSFRLLIDTVSAEHQFDQARAICRGQQYLTPSQEFFGKLDVFNAIFGSSIAAYYVCCWSQLPCLQLL
jgi:hypothetical protein